MPYTINDGTQRPVRQSIALLDIVPVSAETALRIAVSEAPDGLLRAVALEADIQLTGSPLLITSGKMIVLQSAGIPPDGPFQLIGANGQSTITVANGGTLTLDGVTVTHNPGETGNGVTVNSGGTLTMDGGAVFGNTTSSNGGGVTNYGMLILNDGAEVSGNTGYNGGGVYNQGGTFIMNGGEVRTNITESVNGSGGGVDNNINAIFEMYDGTISGNTARGSGGGVYNFNSSTFTLYGGVISGNTVYRPTSSDGGGGGVYNGALFTMHGGKVFNNTSNGYGGGGVQNSGTFELIAGMIFKNSASSNYNYCGGGGVHNRGIFYMTGGTITNNSTPQANGGGGVFSSQVATSNDNSMFHMSGGTISKNTAANGSGGGVRNTGTFTLSGDAKITRNTSVTGGGVSSSQVATNSGTSTFYMNGGTIGGENPEDANTATSGGGVYVATGTFSMTDGHISNNIVAAQGGGVYNSASQFSMSGGEISKNKTTAYGSYGGGVYNDGRFTMTMSGPAKISGNSASFGGGGVANYYASTTGNNNAVFTMEGGTISGNTATGTEDIPYSAGGGVSNQGVVFNMKNGMISGNRAVSGGGVASSYYQSPFNTTCNMSGGEISGNTATGGFISGEGGGGVHNTGIVYNMSGGAIFGNRANAVGGAVRSIDSRFTMTGGMIGNADPAKGNTAVNGGGVYNNGGTLTMQSVDGSNPTITGNAATNDGGGVYNGRTFLMEGGTVSGNTAAVNGGGVSNSGTIYVAALTLSGGKISGNEATSGGGIYNTGEFIVSDGGISGNTATQNGGGIYQNTTRLLSVSGDSMITDNTADGDGGGIWISYANLPNLTVGSDVVFSGNSAFRAFNRNPDDDALYYSHIFATVWTAPFPQGYNNYDIAYTNGTLFAFPTNITLSARKFASGAPLPAGRFVFGVFDGTGNLIATASNDAAGNVTFPPITISETGTFHFSIREISLSGGNWTVDESVFPVVVTSVDNGTGQLVVSIDYPEGEPSFTDIFSPVPVSESVVAFKELHNWPHPEIPFTFGLFDANGNPMETAQNTGGVVVFPEIPFVKPGVFYFTVRELTPAGNGWITDRRVFPAVVTVTQNEQGQLLASVSYPDGQPTFADTYSVIPAAVRLKAKKTVCGAPLCAGAFCFGLFDQSGNQVAQCANDACGNVCFPVFLFAEPGTVQFTVRELTPSGCGWTTDQRVFPVTIAVTDNKRGELTADVTYPDGFPSFINHSNELS